VVSLNSTSGFTDLAAFKVLVRLAIQSGLRRKVQLTNAMDSKSRSGLTICAFAGFHSGRLSIPIRKGEHRAELCLWQSVAVFTEGN